MTHSVPTSRSSDLAHDSGRRLPAEARRLRRILRPAFARYLPPRARARRTDLPAVLPMGRRLVRRRLRHLDVDRRAGLRGDRGAFPGVRSEEHTSELQSLMRISYAVFCLQKT